MSEVRFSGFQIVEEVGGGPTGVVFRCRGAAGGEVAVKRLNALGIDRERIGRNCRRFLSAPSHEGVVPIMEFQIDSAPYFIASDWVESGHRFSDLPGAVNERDAWPQVIKLAEALAHLHRHGVHHGNLHPGNVFVEMGDGIRCRVADFGPGLAGKVHHLNLGETAWFAPPEQLESSLHWDDGAIERWDVYRFGALAFWLINGVTPRGAEYRAARERQIEISGGRPVEVDMAALAADMASVDACGWMVEPADRECELRRRIIDQCLKLNPEERPVDMREVCDAFAALERQFEAERTEARIQKTLDDADTRIRQTIEEAEARVLRERQLQASNLRRTRWLAAGLAATLLIGTAFLVRYFQRSQSFANRISELNLVIGQQKYQIDELDRHRTQSAHELRNAREAADAVFAQIGGTAETGDGPLVEGSIEWENLQKTKSFIDQSLKNSESDPSKELERARDLHHLAQIDARLGNSGAARDRLKQAVGAFETVLAERSNEPKVAADCEARLADCHETLAGMMDPDLDEERLHELKEAARLLKRLSELRPQDAKLAMRRLGADFRLGRQLHEHRDFPAALATFTSVGAQLDRQMIGEPESRPLREMVAEVQYHSALTLREVRRTKEAADAFTAAMETITELCGDLPPTEEQCVRLGGIYADLGEMFSGQATDEECGQLLNEACRLLNPVHDRRPEHLETAITLGRALSRLALIDQRANRWSDGYKMSVSAVEGVEKALESDPSSIEGRLTLIELRGNHLELVKYQRGTAKKILTKGFDMAESVREDLDAAVTLPRAIRDGWRLKLAGLYETYGNVSKALGDDEKARLCHERASQAREVLVTQGPLQEVAPTVEATRAESL